ncbi:cytochrome c oxidase subunit 4 [Leucobacter triazinivorans]|uniref:Cytochrome c oxidase polypeptide 4 n=1 Tax=Leucobacter triazinivorans TaxID=1784719 RepID=A0A4P6KDZ0_9MICO|nr:cytochrome c oxidase subunit 4 [Leucobacter triazinivorans]QBE47604.1 cytochrome c oxidase subunit 4 [Leucobacter triazinivorans]
MKSNIVLFWLLTAYFVLLATVYTLWNVIEHGYIEWSGSVTILLSAGLTGFIAFYLVLVQKKQGGVLVEDREDSDIDDGDPELGEFSPWSWWPIFLAFGASLVVLGLCIGFNFWLSFIALPIVLVGVVGWVYEYYRGNFAR